MKKGGKKIERKGRSNQTKKREGILIDLGIVEKKDLSTSRRSEKTAEELNSRISSPNTRVEI